MHPFVGQDAAQVVLGESIGRLREIMLRQGSQDVLKRVAFRWPPVLGGDLNPI
jgi:hypothetical protein